jgi:hypothetical protein
LRFKVSEAVNNKYFDIERSADGNSFAKIGTVDARPGTTSTYTFNDHNPTLQGINYYRIKQVDKDGTFSYSVVRSVSFGSTGKNLVSPNPARDFINAFSNEDNTKVYLYDASGKRMSVNTITKGSVRIDMSKLPNGMYNVVFEKDGKKTGVEKIVKQ